MFFVSLEGLDCSGKSTIIKKLSKKLSDDGYDVLTTREPGGNKISENIRKIILNKKHFNMNYWTEALLYIASRSQHLNEVIIPALKANKIVLCDRFLDSTTAYQGSGRNISIKDLDVIQKIVIGDNLPELTLFLDINFETMHKRLSKRWNKNKNRLDLQNNDFYKRVRDGYNELHKLNEKRFKKIDANLDIENVFLDCYNEIKKKL